MKRKMLQFFVSAAVMAMALSVTACGGSGKESEPAKTESGANGTDAAGPDAEGADSDDAAGTDTEGADAAGSGAEGTGSDDAVGTDADGSDQTNAEAGESGASTLEDLFQNPAVKDSLESTTQNLASDGMSVSVSAVGNEMIFEFKIEDSSLVTDSTGETLDKALDAQAETFKEQAKAMDAAISQMGACTCTVRYLDPDGNVLAEKSFKAE